MSTSPCLSCPTPGRCCRKFVLSLSATQNDEGRRKLEAAIKEHGLPFVVGEPTPAIGDGRRSFYCSCPLLDAAGRCSEYDSRPDTCIEFQPGGDALCVLPYACPAPRDVVTPT